MMTYIIYIFQRGTAINFQRERQKNINLKQETNEKVLSCTILHGSVFIAHPQGTVLGPVSVFNHM